MARLATNNDIDAIEEIYNLIHDSEENGEMTIGWNRQIYPIRQTAIDAVNRGDMFVLEDNGKMVASGIINHNQVKEYDQVDWKYSASDDEVMVLHTLTVDPNESRKGYAKQFVQFYQDYSKEHNAKALRIDTQEKNEVARTMYKKLGFIESGVVTCCFNGIPSISMVCLEKEV